MQAETSYEGRTGAGGALTTAHGGYKGVDDGLVTARHGLSHMDEGPYRAEQLLDAFCMQRGLVQQNSGLPDYNRAARLILADYLSGKLPHWALPP
jgi:ribosome biogenesis GTPase A